MKGRSHFWMSRLRRKKLGKFSTEVYRKNTHTDRYIKYASHHHPRTKTGAIACLRNRAEKVCDQQFLKSTNIISEEDLEANGYPPSLVSPELHQETSQPTQSQ